MVTTKVFYLLLLATIIAGQYDNVDLGLEEEEEDFDQEEEQQQQVEIIPGAVDDPAMSTAAKALMFKLPENYSVHKSPPLADPSSPLPVDFSILIFNLFDVRELQEEISLEVNYKLQWKDVRLMNWTKNIDPGERFATISTNTLYKIWHPDLFIDHIKRVTQPQLISAASSLRIYDDGSLRFTARSLLTLTCRMDFHYFPADTQQCNITLKSFAYSTTHIYLRWKDDIGALLAKSIDVHNFDIALETHPDFLQGTKSNNFSGISFGLKMRRKLSYHIIQTYIPSTLFSIVSWLSFLVPPDSTPGRMAICVTTLLTVTAMFGSIKQNTPNVAYIKALDLWMLSCIVFIFISLAEFTVVLKLRSMKEKPSQQQKDKITVIEKVYSENNCFQFCSWKNKKDASTMTNTELLLPKATPPPTTKYFQWARKIEYYSPRIVPVIFVTFISCYWPWMLISGNYFGGLDNGDARSMFFYG